MPTFNLTAPSKKAIKEYRETLNKIVDAESLDSQAQALELLFKVYFKGISEIERDREPASVQQTIEKINCPFLKYEEYDFKCFERFDAKKKPDNLGTDPGKILIRCEGCKEGKAQAILQQYQKKLRGQNIRGLLQMIRTFEDFAQKGVPSTIYFCNRIKGKQIFTGQKTITCTKHDARVPIDTCKDPLCPHFEEYIITVEQEFPREALALIEGIAEDYKRIEDLSPGERKEVDSTQEPEAEEPKPKKNEKKKNGDN